jgi:hypothetical protein
VARAEEVVSGDEVPDDVPRIPGPVALGFRLYRGDWSFEVSANGTFDVIASSYGGNRRQVRQLELLPDGSMLAVLL